jgi:SulP family sulfate permease
VRLPERLRGADLRGLLPARADYAGLSRSWRGDLLAGLTVGVVALPLALGFGVASGVGPAAGIITAIVAGVIAAVFGGSAVQVSGPTGAMAVVLAPIVASQGARAVATVAIMAGVIVIVMGVFGLGRAIHFVPWPVLEGFTVGIAVTIALQQVPLLLGQSGGTGTSVLDSAWRAVAGASRDGAGRTLALAAAVALVMVLWPRLNRRIPGSIVAVIVVTAVSVLAHLSVPTISALPHTLPAPALPALGGATLRRLFGPALAVAALAAIESLLSARVADTMTGWSQVSERREMFGQGLANVAAGLFGGMPATGAIARTAVNVRSGARTRVAALTHAVVIAAVIVCAEPLVSRIPLAVLGGVLVVTAVKMVDHSRVRAVVRAHAGEAVVFALTAVVTVVVDLVTAIEVGLLLAGAMALHALARTSGATEESLDETDRDSGDELGHLDEHVAVFRLDGALFFGAAPRFTAALRDVRDVRVVILRLRGLTFVDASGADTLGRMIEDLEARGITVLVKGARVEHGRVLASAGVLESVRARGHLFVELDAALAHARRHVDLGELADETLSA